MLSQGNLEALQKPSTSPKEDEIRKAPERPEDRQEDGKKEEGEGRGTEIQKNVEVLKQALDKARADLARKKGELKEFEQLFVGTLKGLLHGEKKANIQKEYDEFLKRYQEARAKYVVADVSKLTEERMTLAEALVEAKGEGKEHFLYKGYKWLGDQNVAKLFGEKFRWKLSDEFQKDHPLASGALRVAGKFLSVRTALSMGLLGAGLMAGAGSGLALGLGIFGARAAMRGIGTAAGSHDMLKLIGSEAWESKGTLKYKKEEPWYKKVSLWEKLTPEEMRSMGKEKIEERLANMEANALLHGKKVSESEVYKQLLSEYESKLKTEMHEKGEATVSFIKDLSDASDKKRDDLAREKRIKHQVVVGALTAAMVILPGISQFQRVIDKNAAEWAAVTKQAGEISTKARDIVLGGPAEAKVPEAVVFRDLHTIGGLKDKAVKFALETSNHTKPDHQLSIEDIRHIRNIASRATEDGVSAKKLLQYIEKRNLVEQSGISIVKLDGNHATVYGALQEAQKEHPEYFKEVSVDQRAMALAKEYKVTVDQLKMLPHAGERLYFSKDGVIITQEKALVWQAGNVSHTHEAAAGARAHVASTGAAEHAPRAIHREVAHPARGAEEVRNIKKEIRSAAIDEVDPRDAQSTPVVTEQKIGIHVEESSAGKLSTHELPGEKVKIEIVEDVPLKAPPAEQGVGQQLSSAKSPERVPFSSDIEGIPKTRPDIHTNTPTAAEQKIGIHVEKSSVAKLSTRELPGEKVKIEIVEDVPLKAPPAEIFSKGFDQAHIAEFMSAARENPDEFLKFYKNISHGLLDSNHLKINPDQLKMAITDQAAGESNIKILLKAAADYGAHKPIKSLELSIGGVSREFSFIHEVAPGVKAPPEVSRVSVAEVATEQVPRGRISVDMKNFYGGRVFGSVKFNYDEQGNPIGYKTDAQMFGVGSSHDLENKFLFSGWGYDKSTKISEILWENKSRIDTNLLRSMLHQYNKQLAFDMRLYDELMASGHKAEAGSVLKGAKQILARVHEYGLDDQLINKENLPPELR